MRLAFNLCKHLWSSKPGFTTLSLLPNNSVAIKQLKRCTAAIGSAAPHLDLAGLALRWCYGDQAVVAQMLGNLWLAAWDVSRDNNGHLHIV